MAEILARCPVCEGTLNVSELTCEDCGTQVRSRFEPCRFCRLTAAQRELVETFLRSRGNISALCEQMGLSYPTVVKRLEAAINALGLPGGTEGTQPQDARKDRVHEDRTRVLEMLDRGEITAEEATRRLQEL